MHSVNVRTSPKNSAHAPIETAVAWATEIRKNDPKKQSLSVQHLFAWEHTCNGLYNIQSMYKARLDELTWDLLIVQPETGMYLKRNVVWVVTPRLACHALSLASCFSLP